MAQIITNMTIETTNQTNHSDQIVSDNIDKVENSGETSPPILYETMYKKGNMKGEIRFYHTGGLEAAVHDVKAYLFRKHLKHLHTMPFVIDLKNDDLDEQLRMVV